MGRNVVIRTIKNGQVIVFGKRYAPDSKHAKYDGRLDGMRYAFGIYRNENDEAYMLGLWGKESTYRNPDCANLFAKDFYGPEMLPDNSLPWAFWPEVPEQEFRAQEQEKDAMRQMGAAQ